MLKGHSLYQFGEFTLDPVARVLFRNGEPVRMTRRTVETLLVLVENAGQVLTKEEIMRAVWTDRVVDEANLAQNIAVIRKTLGVAKGSPGWIETFPGRGYRLGGPVTTPDALAPAASPAPATNPPEPPSGPEDSPSSPRRGGRWGILAASALVVVLGLGAWWRYADRPVSTAEAFPVTPATRLPGKEYQPALSPDGSALAFLWVDDDHSAPSVWLIGKGDSAPGRVSKSNAHHSSPSWSPDGQHLAYLRIERNATHLILADVGRRTERVLKSFSPPSYGFDYRLLDWSPDGRWLAVSHAEETGGPPGIWVVSAADGSARALTDPGSSASGDVDPRFAPDGSRVTFIRMLHRSRQEVFSVGLESGSPTTQVTQLGRRISGHEWFPDGRTLLIASSPSTEFRVSKFPANGRGSLQPVGVYSEFPIHLSIARRAPALVYATLHQDRNIWRLDLQSGAWSRVIATTAQDASPVYSPDGSRIAFRSDRSGEEQLWVSSADGSDPVQITPDGARPSVGRWSPDGKAIVFNDPQTFEMFVTAPDGSRWSLRRLDARGIHPVFSVDGRWIFAGGSQIIRMPAGGGPPEIIANTRGEALATSPDGRYLYFVREPNDSSLWRLPLDGSSGPERVLDQILPGCTSCWSLAKHGIYYLGTMPEALDRQALFYHSFTARGPDRVIAEYPEPLWPQGSGPFSLSPDGRYLLVVRVGPSLGDVMRVEPFR